MSCDLNTLHATVRDLLVAMRTGSGYETTSDLGWKVVVALRDGHPALISEGWSFLPAPNRIRLRRMHDALCEGGYLLTHPDEVEQLAEDVLAIGSGPPAFPPRQNTPRSAGPPASDPGGGTVNSSPPSGENAPEAREEICNPLTQTLELLPRGHVAPKLIRYLDAAPNRTRKLREVSKHIYKDQSKPTLSKTGTLIRRTRKTLEERESPLRIDWDPGKGKITLLKTSAC